MNKLYLLLLLLFYPIISNAQDVLLEKSYGSTHVDYSFDTQPTADYGFIFIMLDARDKNSTIGSNDFVTF